MSRILKNSFHRCSVLCLLAAMGGGAAHAGIFHHKNKPLSQKDDALASINSQQPDKELFSRAMVALKKGKYDIARLDLQTLLNTYPDSEYAMRAKLAIGDTWYKEGGTAAMQQAEEEYKDFITFFPDKPEAAEAQMKVADIYYKQMQKPDRDPTNAVRAQEEYRAMILQYPDSTLIPQAKERLREVQEVLGDHEFDIGSFYQTRMNYAASIARLQSIIDTYPLYSRVDEALLDVGDAYAAQAQGAAQLKLDPAAKKRIVNLYTQRAQHAYDRVILEYPMMTHADDARDRLEAMGLPIPQPSKEALARSAAIEQSRSPVNLKYRAVILITARPSVVQAAHVGEPSLSDPPQVMAPAVVKETMADINWAVKPDGKPAPSTVGASNQITPAAVAANPGPSAATPATPAASSENTAAGSNALEMHDLSGNGTVVDNNADTSASPNAPANATQSAPAAANHGTGSAAQWPSAKPDNGGLKGVAPENNTPLPAATAPAEAPAQVNDVHSTGHAVNTANETQAATGKKKKKNPKPAFLGNEESSSTHKKKKGIHKLNPF
jgi:outer membrane protein assembly factor BamD